MNLDTFQRGQHIGTLAAKLRTSMWCEPRPFDFDDKAFEQTYVSGFLTNGPSIFRSQYVVLTALEVEPELGVKLVLNNQRCLVEAERSGRIDVDRMLVAPDERLNLWISAPGGAPVEQFEIRFRGWEVSPSTVRELADAVNGRPVMGARFMRALTSMKDLDVSPNEATPAWL